MLAFGKVKGEYSTKKKHHTDNIQRKNIYRGLVSQNCCKPKGRQRHYVPTETQCAFGKVVASEQMWDIVTLEQAHKNVSFTKI